MTLTLSALQKQRRDTAANWTAENPTLLAGEIGIESDTDKIKIGNGSTAWTSLGYQGIIPSSGVYPLSQLLMPSGTASAPSISFDGDTNTGVYRTGADQLAISTNGAGRLFVDASGNVALGVTTFSKPFTINNANAAIALRANSGGAYTDQGIFFAVDGTNYSQIYNDGAGQLIFRTGSGLNERLRITSAGLVGIGTSAPQNLLHLRSDSNSAVTQLYLMNRTSGASVESRIAFTTSANDLADNRHAYIGAVTTGAGANGNSFVIATNPDGGSAQTRVFVSSTGNVGIGTSSPTHSLDINSAIRLRGAGASTEEGDLHLYYVSNSNRATITSSTNGAIVFENGIGAVSERARIDSSGRLLVGTSSAFTGLYGGNNALYINSPNGQCISYFANSAVGARLDFLRSRNATTGSHTVMQSGDDLGGVYWGGSDGTAFVPAAFVRAEVDGTPGTNDMPGRLVFSTTADGASSPTERMRISQDGTVTIGKTSADLTAAGTYVTAGGALAVTRSGATPLLVNRLASDGTLVIFYQDSTQEGDISVSGTTVSYNGAHLSRWSQLPGGADRIEILRGSVLSNIDEMCEWGDEDNEQLNRMKVSDVEGDKNVSGVFQAWDDNDDTYTNDFYCAMTGDFIIRIGAGVTVERGDLLMSAGDGTAKPQDDDIIRSKTIAKVTSTNVSCTYADGSYCVPCVLMAC